MFKRIIFVFTFLFIFVPNLVLAQTIDEPLNVEPAVKPVITALDFIKVNKKIIFDASASVLDSEQKDLVYYRWDFGDGMWQSGQEVVHQYDKIGNYEVELTLTIGDEIFSVSQNVLVYDKKALLITDEQKSEEIGLIEEQAAENGVALKVFSVVNEDGFLSEDRLVQAITEETDYIKGADTLIFYTKSALGIQSFTRYFQDLKDSEKDILRNKYFVKITDSSMDVAQNLVFQSFKIIGPEFILLTRPEALNPIFTSQNYSDLTADLHGRGVEYRIVDDRTGKPWYYFLSHLLTYFVSRGVPSNTLYLILILPFLTFITVFFRQVIGFSTFGVYAPVMIAASFYILGLDLGLITFFFVVMTAYFLKYVINKFELLYLPKVALNLSFISLSFFAVIWVYLWLDVPLSFSLAIFPMLVMSTISEKFMAAQSEEGFSGAFWGVVETLLVVVVSYYLITRVSFNNILLSYPEMVFIPFILNFILGKFSGLRLNEYFRFRSLFSDHTEE